MSVPGTRDVSFWKNKLQYGKARHTRYK